MKDKAFFVNQQTINEEPRLAVNIAMADKATLYIVYMYPDAYI